MLQPRRCAFSAAALRPWHFGLSRPLGMDLLFLPSEDVPRFGTTCSTVSAPPSTILKAPASSRGCHDRFDDQCEPEQQRRRGDHERSSARCDCDERTTRRIMWKHQAEDLGSRPPTGSQAHSGPGTAEAQAAPTVNGKRTSTAPPLATNTGNFQALIVPVTQASTSRSATVLRTMLG